MRLGFVLGPMLELYFRRAMRLSRGSFMTFVTRPDSASLLGLIATFVAWQRWGCRRGRHDAACRWRPEA